jgi:phosphoribosylanthranilate isomerase
MKKVILPLMAACIFSLDTFAQQVQYKIITSVESIIPAGIGRSRLIENQETVDVGSISTDRKSGTDSKQGNVKRKDLKIDELRETKLLNFFSVGGINFQNIASNDAIVESRLSELAAEGWELAFVTSGVESDAGQQDGQGIFITRYIFKRTVR